jgi:hypothetical protein
MSIPPVIGMFFDQSRDQADSGKMHDSGRQHDQHG